MSNRLEFSDKALENEIYAKIIQGADKVFPIDTDEGRVWVKRAEKSGTNLLQHIAYKIFRSSLLIPVSTKNKNETLVFEASKIQEIKKVFEFVPTLIGVNEHFMVICDCGKSLLATVEDKIKRGESVNVILKEALSVLASFHNCALFHGGSQIKNFTIKDNQIYLVDFEESFNENIDLKTLQFRDLFLFLISISKTKVKIDYKELIDIYISSTGNSDFIDMFRDSVKRISLLVKVLDIDFIRSKMDKDTKSVYALVLELKKL